MLPTRSLATIAATAVLLSLTALPSQAEVLRFDRVSEAYAFDTSECGFPLAVEGQFSLAGHLRVGKNEDDSAFFEHSRITSREVWTNTLTGQWFVVRGSAVFHETTATRVDGSTFELTQLLAGQPFVVEDSGGRVVSRDRGAIRYHVVFDTLGDDAPGGEFLDLLSVDVSGPHPAADTDICRYAAGLAGYRAERCRRHAVRGCAAASPGLRGQPHPVEPHSASSGVFIGS